MADMVHLPSMEEIKATTPDKWLLLMIERERARMVHYANTGQYASAHEMSIRVSAFGDILKYIKSYELLFNTNG